MARLLITVTDTFAIDNRGVLLLPSIEPKDYAQIRAGTAIRLVRPDGVELQTTIGDVETMHDSQNCGPFILLRDLRREEVPPGTQVCSVNRG
jgi:hypothetical protein